MMKMGRSTGMKGETTRVARRDFPPGTDTQTSKRLEREVEEDYRGMISCLRQAREQNPASL